MAIKPEVLAAPSPRVAPPQPKGIGSLRVLKQVYRDWITAGGTPINGWT